MRGCEQFAVAVGSGSSGSSWFMAGLECSSSAAYWHSVRTVCPGVNPDIYF